MPGAQRGAPLVGRERELAALIERLAAARRGEGGVVLVAGEPGIGKTRLLSEFAARTRADGLCVLAGRAYEGEGLPPYLPFVEVLRAYARGRGDTPLREALGDDAEAVARLLPELRRLLPRGKARAGEPDRYALFEGVCACLRRVAADAPGLLLVLDDLHWADKPTLLLLLHLARQVQSAPLLVAGAYRTTDLPRSHPLSEALAELRRERLSERLLLPSLSQFEATTLIAGLSGVQPAAAVVEAIYQETDGNAFFVEEVVQHLAEEGRDLRDPAAALGGLGIPEGVREVLGRRLSRLSEAANELARAAAVLSDGSAFELLPALLGAERGVLTEALEETLSAGLLRRDGDGYGFSHALIRQTLLEELSLPRRQHLHLRAAEALEQVHAANLKPHAAALAGHLRQAGAAADAAKTLHYTKLAAQEAEAVFAWEQAANHWQAALDAMKATGEPDPRERCELLLALGEAQWRTAAFPAWKETFLQAARAGGTPEQRAQAALGYAEVAGIGEQAMTAIDLLEEALTALGDADSPVRARTLGLLAEVLLWSGQPEARGLALTAEALAMARRLGDPHTLAFTLNERLWALSGAEFLVEREAAAVELIAVAAQIGNVDLRFKGHRWHAGNLLQRGEMRAVDQEVSVLVGLAEQFCQPHYRAQAFGLQCIQALRDGRIEDYERYAAELAALRAHTHSPWSQLSAALHAFAQYRLCGQLADTEAALREAVQALPSFPLPRAALALLLAEARREAEARDLIDSLSANEFRDLPRNWMWLNTIVWLAGASHALAEPRSAAALYSLLLPLAGRYTAGGDTGTASAATEGVVDQFLALLATALGRTEAAERHFAAALDLNQRMAAPVALAQTQREYAAMLLRRGKRQDLPRARALLEAAIATCEELGMAYWAEKARVLLAQPRLARAQPAKPALPDGLSEREVEVLRLAAEGRSNAEIAAALVISPFTVLRHMNHIFAKTGAGNRTEAAAYAHRRGLVGDAGGRPSPPSPLPILGEGRSSLKRSDY